jgi:hypothetical protein
VGLNCTSTWYLLREVLVDVIDFVWQVEFY